MNSKPNTFLIITLEKLEMSETSNYNILNDGKRNSIGSVAATVTLSVIGLFVVGALMISIFGLVFGFESSKDVDTALSEIDTNDALIAQLQELAATLQPTLVGEIKLWTNVTSPSGWLLCDGSAVSREDYSSLFDVLGEQWGSGDGSTTFNLPDMRGRSPVGSGTGVYNVGGVAHLAAQSFVPKLLGEMAGAEYTSQLAVNAEGSDTASPVDAYIGATGGNIVYNEEDATGTTLGNTEGGNYHPYTVVNFIIKY